MNRSVLTFSAAAENEAFARTAAAAFFAPLDPTMEELAEIRTGVSEAVSNCVIYAYPEGTGDICMECVYEEDRKVRITIRDFGCGIADVKKAMEPMYTTGDPAERSGMGFTVMESFMDRLQVESEPGKGTRVTMVKLLDALALE